MNPNPSTRPPRFNPKTFMAALLVPALLTIGVGFFHSAIVTQAVVMLGGGAGAVIAGVILSRTITKPVWLRFLLLPLLIIAMLNLVLLFCFIGCACAGGGGVRIGG